MDLLKTPHQKLLEEAGAVPDSPGLLKTPRQLLFEESGMLPKYAQGKSVRDIDRKSTRLNSSHIPLSRMPSSA